MWSKGANILLALLCMCGAALFYTKVMQGFSLQEIRSSIPLDYAPLELSLEREEEIKQALAQPYRYLAKGCQFYVFESSDGKYIIKFLKYKHLRKEPFVALTCLPLPDIWRGACMTKIACRQQRLDKLFSSIKIAYDDLPMETGLLFYHFNRSPFLQGKLEIRDPLGLRYKIDLDAYDYLIQKKANSVKSCFENSDNRPDEIRKRIGQLIEIVEVQCSKGIINTDRAFVQNVGFSPDETRALLIDIGQFVKEEGIKDEKSIAEERGRRLRSLRGWMERHFPHLLPYVDERL